MYNTSQQSPQPCHFSLDNMLFTELNTIIDHNIIQHGMYVLYVAYDYQYQHNIHNAILNTAQPILFLHGNAGHYRQSRWLFSYINDRQGHYKNSYVYYTISYNEQYSAFSSITINNQLQYTHDVLQYIYRKHNNNRLIVIGHSIGGLIAALLPSVYSDMNDKIQLIVALGSPLLHSPTPFIDSQLSLYYTQLHEYWSQSNQSIRLLSISGGYKDYQVEPYLSTITNSAIQYSISDHMASIGFSIDHPPLPWCNQLVRYNGDYIIGHINHHNHIANQHQHVHSQIATVNSTILPSTFLSYHTHHSSVKYHIPAMTEHIIQLSCIVPADTTCKYNIQYHHSDIVQPLLCQPHQSIHLYRQSTSYILSIELHDGECTVSVQCISTLLRIVWLNLYRLPQVVVGFILLNTIVSSNTLPQKQQCSTKSLLMLCATGLILFMLMADYNRYYYTATFIISITAYCIANTLGYIVQLLCQLLQVNVQQTTLIALFTVFSVINILLSSMVSTRRMLYGLCISTMIWLYQCDVKCKQCVNHTTIVILYTMLSILPHSAIASNYDTQSVLVKYYMLSTIYLLTVSLSHACTHNNNDRSMISKQLNLIQYIIRIVIAIWLLSSNTSDSVTTTIILSILVNIMLYVHNYICSGNLVKTIHSN